MASLNLFKLDQVGTTRSWDYTQPTLQTTGRFTTRTPTSNQSFVNTFYQTYPGLKNMDWSNLFLRGGSIVSMLLQTHVNDLDFFVYGLNDEAEVINRVRKFIQFLLDVERKYVEEENNKQTIHTRRSEWSAGEVKKINIKAVRQGPVITILMSAIKTPIQIILGINEMEDLLMNVDIAVSGCIFDGTDVLMTSECKWELENMSIIVNEKYYPNISRIVKYFNKGFDIILPDLDVNKMPISGLKYNKYGISEYIETPSIGFTYSSIEGNKIDVCVFIDDKKQDNKKQDNKLKSKSIYSSKAVNGFDGRQILYDNIKAIAKMSGVKTKDIELFSVYAESDFVEDVLRPRPLITGRQIANTYPGITTNVYENGKMNFLQYNDFFTVEPLPSVLQRIASIDSNENFEDQCQLIIDDVKQRQIAQTTAFLNVLDEKFKHETTPVIKKGEFIGHKISKEEFYGDYLIGKV